MPWVLPSSPW
jgi:hypothetical protein